MRCAISIAPAGLRAFTGQNDEAKKTVNGLLTRRQSVTSHVDP
jgi:hypothetical protein